jgi:predicted phage replisome organizer
VKGGMAEVSWIKLSTNIFSNRKIALLLNEREGDTYFRIWIQLLTIAGQCNMKGKLIIGENNPLNVQQLSKILGKSVKKVEEILNKFIELKMINLEENCYIIKNWSKYQSADKLEEIRKNNRERQRKFREKSKMENNVTETLE